MRNRAFRKQMTDRKIHINNNSDKSFRIDRRINVQSILPTYLSVNTDDGLAVSRVYFVAAVRAQADPAIQNGKSIALRFSFFVSHRWTNSFWAGWKRIRLLTSFWRSAETRLAEKNLDSHARQLPWRQLSKQRKLRPLTLMWENMEILSEREKMNFILMKIHFHTYKIMIYLKNIIIKKSGVWPPHDKRPRLQILGRWIFWE